MINKYLKLDFKSYKRITLVCKYLNKLPTKEEPAKAAATPIAAPPITM